MRRTRHSVFCCHVSIRFPALIPLRNAPTHPVPVRHVSIHADPCFRDGPLCPLVQHHHPQHQLWRGADLVFNRQGAVQIVPVCRQAGAQREAGAQGWHGFSAACAQIFAGALADGEAFARTHGMVPLFALVSLKLCAFNLLPFAGLAGGQVLLVLARGGIPRVAWEETVTKWLLLPGLAVLLAWLVAFVWHAWKALTT